jgi:hypothetical protein
LSCMDRLLSLRTDFVEVPLRGREALARDLF